jgi:hypothetical protein
MKKKFKEKTQQKQKESQATQKGQKAKNYIRKALKYLIGSL